MVHFALAAKFVPGGLVKLEAVKGREGAKKRPAAGEKESVVVHVEQVDMAGPVSPKEDRIYYPMQSNAP